MEGDIGGIIEELKMRKGDISGHGRNVNMTLQVRSTMDAIYYSSPRVE